MALKTPQSIADTTLEGPAISRLDPEDGEMQATSAGRGSREKPRQK
jgi:hypothetical protein